MKARIFGVSGTSHSASLVRPISLRDLLLLWRSLYGTTALVIHQDLSPLDQLKSRMPTQADTLKCFNNGRRDRAVDLWILRRRPSHPLGPWVPPPPEEPLSRRSLLPVRCNIPFSFQRTWKI